MIKSAGGRFETHAATTIPILTPRIPTLTARSLVCHGGHLNCVMGIVCRPHALNRPPADFAMTAILCMAAKEQPDVMSRQLNSLAVVCNWSIVKL